MDNFLLALELALIGTLINSIAAILLKKGSKKFSLLNLFKNCYLIMGFILYLFSTIFFMLLLKLMPLSIAYPLTSLSYIWTVLFSFLFLKEKFSLNKVFGVGLIILGIVFLNL